jgi:hypothetical protein
VHWPSLPLPSSEEITTRSRVRPSAWGSDGV